VFKFLVLIAKNLGRNKVRTTLTFAAVVVLTCVFTVVNTITTTVDRVVKAQGSQNKLIVSERWVMPSLLPLRYVPEISQISGVQDWTVWHYYGGYFDESLREDRMGLGIATRVDNLLAMHEGLGNVDPAAVQALQAERTGALVGREILETMQWQIGQQFTFTSSSHEGQNLRFKIVGEIPDGAWSESFFFRDDYFREASGEESDVNLILLRVADAAAVDQVTAEIMQRFERRQPELSVETEASSIARIAGRHEAVLSVIRVVVAVLLVDMIVVISNSITIATRERRVEMSVLKVLGFQPFQIAVLVIGEAMLVGGLSGFTGTGIAWSLSELVGRGMLSANEVTGFLLTFPIPDRALIWGTALGLAIGLAGSIVPAWSARSAKVSDVFAKIS
jgi:putative ABC transport system permease protein